MESAYACLAICKGEIQTYERLFISKINSMNIDFVTKNRRSTYIYIYIYMCVCVYMYV